MVKKKRVICALSGGVDSSVAAALLKRQGYEVVGVFMKLWSDKDARTDLVRENICCSAEAATAARAVANKLRIPFYVVNLEQEFKKAVVDYYIKEYENGRTPNPCIICNRDIKGEVLMRKVLALKADYLATGHYARLGKVNNKYQLLRAADNNKDQTYFLWILTQKQLSKLLFPIGDYTKLEVRRMAKKWDLPTAKRQESQGICFIPDRDVGGFLRRQAKRLTKPGSIYDLGGKKLGLHHGLVNYTIGQRERLGLGGPRAYYVIKLNSQDNRLIVGDEKDLYCRGLIGEDLNWINSKPGAKALGGQIRYGHPIESCQLLSTSCKQKVKVIFTKPQRAITPGQSIVFFQGNQVLGGGIIKESF